MHPSNYQLCVKYLKEKVLPYLRLHCKIDAQHLEHNEGDNVASVRLDAPKDFEDVKGYKRIMVEVLVKNNPNIEPHNNPPIIIGGIERSDGSYKEFCWNSLDDMVKGINELK